jgi:uncharacterized membrane protein
VGYDWVRLHAALNDLPAALLLVAVLFDVLGAINRRDSLKAAGFACLVAGVVGGGLAALAGMMAAKTVAHDETAHAVMETHELMAWLTLGSFAVLMAWRLVRRTLSRKEQLVFTAAGVIGVGLLVYTAKLGGNLVFDHGVGVRHTPAAAAEEEHHH